MKSEGEMSGAREVRTAGYPGAQPSKVFPRVVDFKIPNEALLVGDSLQF